MDKKLVMAMLLSTATVMVFQHFMYKGNPYEQSGVIPSQIKKGFIVPNGKEALGSEFNAEIDFLDQKVHKKENLVSIETPFCIYEFSNFGGAISGITFKKRPGVNNRPLRTVFHKDFFHREETCMLLALDNKTPYFYDLDSKNESDNSYDITYKTTALGWLIKKKYTLYKDKYEIDLLLSFEPISDKFEPISPRIFFPSPFIAEIESDAVNGFAYNPSTKSIDKNLSANVYEDIFGSEDRYFAHCMHSDKSNFIKRAYYKKLGDHSLFSILHAGIINNKEEKLVSFYFGPKDIQDLNAVDTRLEGLLSFGWLSSLCKILLQILEFLYRYLKNYGLAIIVLTILIKLPLLPLTLKSAAVLEKYQKYQPQINRIRQKYKSDLQSQNLELMRFYKEHNLSPAGQLIGCLPLLIDMPIMFALYKVLGNYMDLYQAPFFGWITDLSSKDPYYILPILMGLTMVWQQRMTPAADEKQKVMMMFMAIIMAVVFAGFPAGLVLYWFTKNVLTIGETYLRKKITPKTQK